MRRTLLLGSALALLLAPFSSDAQARGKKGRAAPQSKAEAAQAKRAMSELSGKLSWGMSPEDVVKVYDEGLVPKYDELVKKEPDVYKQDLLRKQHQEELEKIRSSLVKFDGKKTGWDSSIVDKEFGHRNDESMMIMWEKDQRRFLFFWHDKLYKQFIAFNAEHPAFAGKSFDDFAEIIQRRYGRAEMKMGTQRSNDEVTLDHLEWPPSGDYTLWAIDQSSFYGNFCLKLMSTSTNVQVEKSRAERSPRGSGRNALIDAVTSPEQVQGDRNADIVDQITGKKH